LVGQSVISDIVIACFCVAVGCLSTRALLRRDRYEAAVWTYIGSLIIAFSVVLTGSGGSDPVTSARPLVPFVFPLIIMLIGFLLPVRDTLIALVICVLATLFLPSISQARFEIRPLQLAAIVLMGLAAGIAAQISGELYGIAEWALDSYRKERGMKDRLFDTQQEVQRSFMRQKALAEQLQSTNQELEKARTAAMEAKNFRGQFLANMSHELRTPLNAIIGFSETMLNFPMMYDDVGLPVAYRGDMAQIYTSGKHLLQLINDILDLSKVDAGKLDIEVEAVELEPILKGVASTAQGLIGEKPVKLRREISPDLPKVRGDSLRLRQVILNLMSNAAKFTDKGEISLGAALQPDSQVLFWVKDSGIGIPPSDLETIFEEFRQGAGGRRKGRAGSGLGLAICKQLLYLMGGKIWVESKLGEGSTFYFTLPAYNAETLATATSGGGQADA
jgi:signal transduction histidine kinase